MSNGFETILLRVESAEYLTLAVGCFLLLVGFLGCYGAGKESSWMLTIFIIIMIVIILAEVAAPILAFIYYPEIESFMENRVETYDRDSAEADAVFNVEFIDQLQVGLQCCGWSSSDDYSDGPLPPSCCKSFTQESLESRKQNPITCHTSSYDMGCEHRLVRGTTVIGFVALGCLFAELLAVVCACCICNKQDNDKFRSFSQQMNVMT